MKAAVADRCHMEGFALSPMPSLSLGHVVAGYVSCALATPHIPDMNAT